MPESAQFEFLRPHRPILADLAAFAERYVGSDPHACLVKLRTFAELVALTLVDTLRLPTTLDANLNDLLNDPTFRSVTPGVVQDKLHYLRRSGNRAAHKHEGTADEALQALREAHEVGRWLVVRLFGADSHAVPVFKQSQLPVETTKGQLQREKKSLLEQIALQDVKLREALTALDDERKARIETEAVRVEPTNTEVVALLDEAAQAAQAVELDELATRRTLIDALLADVGWDVGANGKNTEQVRQEVQLSLIPDEAGNGFADYVLYAADGRPIAVVEAKRTAKSAEAGRTQAWLYANALERATKTRPIIFYTNGHDIFIWDDKAIASLPRKIYGFYSRDSVDYLHHQRVHQKDLLTVASNPAICGRLYQMEAIQAVCERFATGHRKGLLVLATGTGKTRIAVSLCDRMARAGWAKRILFLCDRKELRKQAGNVFGEFLPDTPKVVLSAATANDQNQRIYLATYPSMAKYYTTFDPGFFDLIIADESHRSLYNRYRSLLQWFDAMQVGLTATPRKVMTHHTYRLFGCEQDNPTSFFSYDEAISHDPPYLVPFRVVKTSSKFRREGMKWADRSEEEKAHLEEAGLAEMDVASPEFDRQVLNRDMARQVIRDLMDNGIRDASGSRPGKTIVFARNHPHAKLLTEVFGELYPQYGGTFCQLIDSYDDRAEVLLDQFKDPANNLTVAISVDMLDTGVDVPEVVNLVFAKPVGSYVKFWQMIGRGTRLCPGLFGPGHDKSEFLILDHWNNFEYFGEPKDEKEQSKEKSLLQRLFEKRLALAEAARDAKDAEMTARVVDLLHADVLALLKTKSILVRDHWQEVQQLSKHERIAQLDATTLAALKVDVAPLLGEVDVRGHEPALRFDYLVADAQLAAYVSPAKLATLHARMVQEVELLPKNLAPVKAMESKIDAVKSAALWDQLKPSALEPIRAALRGLIQFQPKGAVASLSPIIIDVADSEQHSAPIVAKLHGQELVAYRQRVREVLEQQLAGNAVIAKIRTGTPVTQAELEALALLVHKVDPLIDLLKLPLQLHAHTDLAHVLRGIVGLDAKAVETAFQEFAHKYVLTAKQQQFLSLIQHHLALAGELIVDRLYDHPFTVLDPDGVDGVFTNDAQIDDLLTLLARFNSGELPAQAA